jgi:hypothetical protein
VRSVTRVIRSRKSHLFVVLPREPSPSRRQPSLLEKDSLKHFSLDFHEELIEASLVLYQRSPGSSSGIACSLGSAQRTVSLSLEPHSAYVSASLLYVRTDRSFHLISLRLVGC